MMYELPDVGEPENPTAEAVTFDSYRVNRGDVVYLDVLAKALAANLAAADYFRGIDKKAAREARVEEAAKIIYEGMYGIAP
jgi:hypothetical protein